MATVFHKRRLLFVPVIFSLFSLISYETIGANSVKNMPYTAPPGASTYDDLFNPVVLVIANDIDRRRQGYGAVIGDGSLVVTAYHIVFNSSEIGLHNMPLFPIVISPYLGDVCYGRILAADRELDLAILEIPWAGHPSYTPASDQELHRIDKVAIFSRIAEDANDKYQLLADPKTERLPIRELSSRHGVVSQVSLKGCGRLSEGWSGCPIIDEETHLLVGCFTTKHSFKPKVHLSFRPDESGYNSKFQEYACGPAAGWMRKLIIEANAADKLNKSDRILDALPDSNKAVRHLCKIIEYEAMQDGSMKKEALNESELFLQLRPESVMGIIIHAGRLRDIGRLNLAEEYYKRAEEYDSSQGYALMAYGQFLEDAKRPDEALVRYRKAEILEPDNSHLAYVIARLITSSNIEDNPLSHVEELIRKHPENGHLLALRAQIYHKQGQIDRAIETTKAMVMLMPEDIRYRRLLSMILEQNHRIDEAETQLRDIIQLAPDNANAYYWLAVFLSKNRPAAREEAIQLAERALHLYQAKRGPVKAKIEKLLSDLKESVNQ